MEWQVVGEPEQDGDEWTVVFRNQEDEDEAYVSYGNGTYFEYQIWGPDGDLVASRWRGDPNEYHSGWESESLEEASDRALSVVEEFAANPGYWKWDGTAESRGLEPVRAEASQ
jgi:hypothetical protein